MIKLRPIVNNILLEDEGDGVTWGNVRKFLEAIQKESKTKKWGNIKAFVKNVFNSDVPETFLTGVLKILGDEGYAEGSVDILKSVVKIGQLISNAQLANPGNTSIGDVKGPLLDKLKISQELSEILDNEIEKRFIEEKLMPILRTPGNDNEPLPNMDEILGKWLNDQGLTTKADVYFTGKGGELEEATMNAQEMARHKKKLEKLKKILATQGDQMMEYPKSLPNTVFNAKLMNEDLRDWFGTGGKGGVGGGGWDRYNSSGDRVGKCGDAKEGEAYSACLSKEKAEKLGKEGRAAFVKRKRAAQKKGGDAKKGGEKTKGQKPIKVKTGVKKENLDPDTFKDTGKSAPYGSGYSSIKNERILKEIELFLEKNTPTDKAKWSYYKSQAEKTFDVYPSAYALGWAAKMYKKAGGGWRKSEK